MDHHRPYPPTRYLQSGETIGNASNDHNALRWQSPTGDRPTTHAQPSGNAGRAGLGLLGALFLLMLLSAATKASPARAMATVHSGAGTRGIRQASPPRRTLLPEDGNTKVFIPRTAVARPELPWRVMIILVCLGLLAVCLAALRNRLDELPTHPQSVQSAAPSSTVTPPTRVQSPKASPRAGKGTFNRGI